MAALFGLKLSYAQSEKDSVKTQSLEVVRLIKHLKSSANNDLTPENSERLSHDAGLFLTQLPEIGAIKRAGQYGLDPVLRGFKNEQLNITIDGAMGAINACPSRMDPPISQVNLSRVKEAQVYKGPYFYRFGPALGATINFETLDPEFKDDPEWGGKFSSALQTNGMHHKSEAGLHYSNKRLHTSLFAGLQKSDSYKDGDGNEVPSSFLRYNLGNKTHLLWNSNHSTEVEISTNQARDVEFAALSMDLLYDKTWMAQIRHKILLPKGIIKSIDLSLFRTSVDHSMGTPDLSMVSNVKSQTHGARAELKALSNGYLLYTGLDYKFQGAKNTSMQMNMGHGMHREGSSWQDSYIGALGWFTQVEKSFHSTKMTLSYRLDYDQAGAHDWSKLFLDLYGKQKQENLNHSVSLGIQKNLSPSISLALWSGRAQRSPSLTERYINLFPVGKDNYEMLGNPLLKPETNFQADLIFGYRAKDLSFQTTFFYSHLTDYISGRIRSDIKKSTMMSPGVRQYVNIEQVLKVGAEASTQVRFSPHWDSSLALAYTYGENRKEKTPLAEIAPLDLRWKTQYHWEAFHAGILVRHAAKQTRIDPSFSELPTKAFTVVDLDMNYQLNNTTELFFAINNLFNTTYSEHLSRTMIQENQKRIQAQGRNLEIGVSFRF